MAETDILTGQYVRIAQTTATVGERIVARLVDYAFLTAYYAVLMWALFSSPFLDHLVDKSRLLAIVIFLLLTLPPLFYSLICEMFFRGQTIGKHLFHLRVVSMDGAQPTFGQLTIRWMFLLVDVWVSAIGILPIALSKRHQRFGDMAAGTIVIHEGDYRQWHAALDDFYWLTPGYKPAYPEAQLLSDGQAHLIDRTLHGKNGYDFDQVEKLAGKVSHFLKVEPRDGAVSFLTKVLHDYQYYTLDLV